MMEFVNWVNETVGITGLIVVAVFFGSLGMASFGRFKKKINNRFENVNVKFEDISDKFAKVKTDMDNSIGQYTPQDIVVKTRLNNIHDAVARKSDESNKSTIYGMVEEIKQSQDLELKRKEAFQEKNSDERMKQSSLALNVMAYTTEQAQKLEIENSKLRQEVQELRIWKERTQDYDKLKEKSITNEKRRIHTTNRDRGLEL